MICLDRLLDLLADARLAGLLFRRGPAFAIAPDGTVRWANAAGAAALGVATLADALALRLPDASPLADLLDRLVRTLPRGGEARLERARLPGGDPFTPSTVACRRLTAPDGEWIAFAALDGGGDRPVPAADVAAFVAPALAEPVLICDDGGRVLARSPSAEPVVALADILADADAALAGLAAGAPVRRTHSGRAVTLHRPAGTERLVLALIGPSPASEPVQAVPDVAADPGPPAEPVAGASVDAPEPLAAPPAPPRARRLPVRFVWQTDVDGLLLHISGELAEAVGPLAADVIGENLVHLAERLGFDRDGKIARAMDKRDTWSGVGVGWPTDAGEQALIDLAGLPVFDRHRSFQGYRGFGVCRAVVPMPVRAAAAVPAEPAPEPVATPPEQAPAPQPARPEPPVIVPSPPNVVPLRAALLDARRAGLSVGERQAFRDIARALAGEPEASALRVAPIPERPAPLADSLAVPSAFAPAAEPAADVAQAGAAGERAVLERLPIAVLVHRGGEVLFANRALFELTGYADLDELARAGGAAALFDAPDLAGAGPQDRVLTVRGAGGAGVPVEARLFSAPWQGGAALVLALRRAASPADDRADAATRALRAAEATTRELRAILDTATDGIVLLDRDGGILEANPAAASLFGYPMSDLVGRSLGILLTADSHRVIADALDVVRGGGVSEEREVTGRLRQGDLVALFLRIGRLVADGSRLCAVFRDISQWKRAEDELVTARRAAERASSHKSDFLAKISHEIRTPLNAIIGFSEVMMEERFGPVGNPRYKEYLRDIHISGTHVVSLVNDLLDLSKIEAGKLDLTFTSVDLNDVLTQCMAIMQPQANRERIIIRSSLAPSLPAVVADARSMRQVALNLLSNSIKFTKPGGQVILSTAQSEAGEVVMRVRDTGIGMSEAEVSAALEPFRQIATSSRAAEGTGLGLPLTKAMVEANRAGFAIKSSVNSGTLVEITFPAGRVLRQ